MNPSRELLEQIAAAHSLYLQLSYDYWIGHSLYTWQWWLLVVIMIIPWYFWWRLVDRKRLLEISCYGFMTFVAVLGSDATGVAYDCWQYPIRLAPKFPHILPVDTTLLPIIFMLVYQSFAKWKDFIIATVIMAAILAFVAEPLAIWMGVYEMTNWKYYYSFPLYIVYGAILKFIIQTIQSAQATGESPKR